MIATATLSRLGELILARLLVGGKRPLSPSKLREDIGRLCQQPPEDARWETLVQRLVDAGLLTTRPYRLTEAGQAQALASLGLDALPPRTTWALLQSRYLIPKALAIADGASSVRERVAREDGLAAFLLKKQYGLGVGGIPSLGQALEALACQRVCKQLGLPVETSFKGLQAAVLSELLGAGEKLSGEQLRKQLPRHAVAGRRPGIAGLREAVLVHWAAETNGKTSEAVPAEVDLPAFARTVEAVASHCPTGRFGDNKVFINHVWRQLQQEPGCPPFDLPSFKHQLVEANRQGLIRLSRADLVQAMDPVDVRESETTYLDSAFHFILLERDRP